MTMVEKGVTPKQNGEIVKTVVVFCENDGNLVTVRHNKSSTVGIGVTGFPGGQQEPNESVEDTAIRELKEETGLVANPTDLIHYPGNDKYRARLKFNGSGWKDAQMTVVIWNGGGGDLAGDSLSGEAEWTPVGSLRKGYYKTSPNFLNVIEDVLSFRAQSPNLDVAKR